jgi:hypothetical protein
MIEDQTSITNLAIELVMTSVSKEIMANAAHYMRDRMYSGLIDQICNLVLGKVVN